MQLSLHADYALRLLLYLGSHPGEVVATATVSDAYGISRHHLVRVAQTLGHHGYVRLLPGRSGGLMLAREPGEIRLGQVVRDAEPNLKLVECFDRETNTCPIISVCGLKPMLKSALEAFLADLDQHTLADLLGPQRSRRLAQALVRIETTKS